MICSAILAVVYVLGFSPADGTAVCFGTDESGAFVPAAFEERRHTPGTADALRGVRTIVFDRDVTNVVDGAFAGAPDLETVAFGESISSLGARAFADSPKLTCVVFFSRNPVDARMDTFAGAHEQLTAVYPRDNYGPVEIKHPKTIWKNMASIQMPCETMRRQRRRNFLAPDLPRREKPVQVVRDDVVYDGPRVTPDGWLLKFEDGVAKPLAYLPPERGAICLPLKICGAVASYRNCGEEDSRDEAKFRVLLIDPPLLEDFRYGYARGLRAKDGWVYVRGSIPDQRSGWIGNFASVPMWTTADDVASLTNGLPCESGYSYIIRGGETAAIVGNENEHDRTRYYSPQPNQKFASVVVPKTLGGKPVSSLPAGLFASRPDIASVEFPDTVEELPDGICYGCPNLREIKLPKGLKRIGRLAFFDCPKLSPPQLPEGVVCETWAFDGTPSADSSVILKP